MTAGHGDAPAARARLAGALRLLVLGGVLLAAIGALGHAVGMLLLTTTLGPTAYVLLTRPDAETARLRNTLAGHATATACGLACLAVFGLWSHPSVVVLRRDTWPQIGAQALAVGLTLFLLAVLDVHHPPAAATALLITSGIARPGPPLYGMLVGLALLIAAGALLSVATRRPLRRAQDGG